MPLVLLLMILLPNTVLGRETGATVVARIIVIVIAFSNCAVKLSLLQKGEGRVQRLVIISVGFRPLSAGLWSVVRG